MYCTREVAPDVYWVGGSDRRLALFENMFPLPDGVSYDAYVILDDKTAALDTVDSAITGQYLENLDHVLNGRHLDYLIVNHMEPDHCAVIGEMVLRHPDLKLVGNKKTFQFISQFYDFPLEGRCIEVKEGDTLNLGRHVLTFVMAPMVHWPEAMVTYDTTEKILFSADAFGTFGAFHGHLFADEVDFQNRYADEARRYYTNIVGKYGSQVQAVLKKAGTIDIQTICPLHGPIWRKDLGWILDKYNHWSSYTPEEPGVVIAYASMYGNTQNAAEILANFLSEKGVKEIRVYDISKTHSSYVISDAFRFSNIVFAAPTYNNGIYFGMEALIRDMIRLNLQNRKVSFIGNGTWVPVCTKDMEKLATEMKNTTVVGDQVVIRSSVKEEQLAALDKLASDIAASL
jgi:flavorubredoxin